MEIGKANILSIFYCIGIIELVWATCEYRVSQRSRNFTSKNEIASKVCSTIGARTHIFNRPTCKSLLRDVIDEGIDTEADVENFVTFACSVNDLISCISTYTFLKNELCLRFYEARQYCNQYQSITGRTCLGNNVELREINLKYRDWFDTRAVNQFMYIELFEDHANRDQFIEGLKLYTTKFPGYVFDKPANPCIPQIPVLYQVFSKLDVSDPSKKSEILVGLCTNTQDKNDCKEDDYSQIVEAHSSGKLHDIDLSRFIGPLCKELPDKGWLLTEKNYGMDSILDLMVDYPDQKADITKMIEAVSSALEYGIAYSEFKQSVYFANQIQNGNLDTLVSYLKLIGQGVAVTLSKSPTDYYNKFVAPIRSIIARYAEGTQGT